jgi:hypothetical protein
MKISTTTINYSSKKVLTFVVAALVLSFGMYSFAIASTTISISDSSLINTDIQDLQTEIAELESSYYVMINELSLEQAMTEGFYEEESVQFAHVYPSTLVAYNN